MLRGFRDFVLRGNVIDLAVAVVIGAAFTQIVTAISTDVIGGLLGALGGVPNLDAVTVPGTQVVIGTTLAATINFLIVAAVVYFAVVLPTNALLRRRERGGTPPPAAKPEDVLLLTEIRDLLQARGGPGPVRD